MYMSSILFKDKDFITEMVNSTKPVIDFDIYVMDENLFRIAGTGIYEQYVGVALSPGCASDFVLKNGHPVVIYDPIDNHVCSECRMKLLCFKEHMIIYPIINNGKTIGAVGLGAFDDEKKLKLRKMEAKLRSYLLNLCSLISAKIKENEYSNRIEKVLNTMDDSIMLLDYSGDVIFYNDKAMKYFDNKEKCKNINSFIPGVNSQLLLKGMEPIKDMEIVLTGILAGKRIYASIYPMDFNDYKSERILIFKDQSKINDIAYRLVSDTSYFEFDIDFIRGNSLALKKSKEMAINASKCDSNVLITGESGTGKELFARAIHQMSSRSKNPFIALNCAAIPDNLMESELFGYEDGAFTGARKGGKPGKFELANGGTLLLDEIGDLSLHLQPKLLRAIEYGEVERVGGVKPIDLDVRIIAVTNRNLEEMILNGEFREDLYYRLNVIPLFIPPLRKRMEDIMILARYFLSTYSQKFNKRTNEISVEAERALLMYDWPGNVRELENVIEYAINIEKTENLKLESLPSQIRNQKGYEGHRGKRLKDVELDMILSTIDKYGNTLKGKEKAAEELGISLSTLYRRLK